MTAIRTFDIVVIGAGPSAIAALQGIAPGRSVAIVTGESAVQVAEKELHPKIRAVSVENGEAPAVANAYRRAHDPARPLFSTAAMGGLANYWGQQFLRYESQDPWPKDLFPDYGAYVSECEAIEHAFLLTGGEEVRPRRGLAPGFRVRVPRLLIGASGRTAEHLMTMRTMLGRVADNLHAEIFRQRATSVRGEGPDPEVALEDGQVIRASVVLLCAGVIGTARIVQQSFPDIDRLRFSDHAPWMLYALGLGDLFALRPKTALRHFNALTLEKTAEGAVTSFASLYDMGRAELNLLLASTIGRTSRMLRGLSAPPGASLLKPVQIWTGRTFDEIEVQASAGVATAVDEGGAAPASDEGLAEARAALSSLGARILKVSRTSPGYGFHYHGLKVKTEGGPFSPVHDFLSERSGGRIVCADASILPRIGVRPHTLTAMAASRRIARQAMDG
jgi:hypothetical protein